MNNYKPNPMLLFEFTDKQGKKNPLKFKDPVKIIQTDDINEVKQKLKEIQIALDEGYYAAGYVSYEAAPAFDSSFIVSENAKMPLLWFGIFNQPATAPYQEENNKNFTISGWKSTTTQESYQKGFNRIKKEIEEGNTYQVNYTMRLQATFDGDDYAFYKQLSKAQSSNYSAYLNIGKFRILSASPELFFRLYDGKLITRPMKGTIQRGKTLAEDKANAEWLYRSEKNRSENVMIVDLLRNDLGSIAKTGTVKVPSLFDIERYPTVWQMTSTVTAEIKPEKSVADIFTALFPCGSITGAPKISTMKIISEVEDTPREVYCGAIGYMTPNKEAVFNVPIRTVIIDSETGEAEYGVGGGITWDSTMEDEYHEAFVKAKLLTENTPEFQLLESLKLENGQYELLERHISRLSQSAEYFNFTISEEKIRHALLEFAYNHPEGVYKVRLLVSKDGEIYVEGHSFTLNDGPVSARLADSPISSQHLFLYHKTTNRKIYKEHHEKNSDVFDTLLWNERGELTEFTMGNLVLDLDGDLITPPISSGLLPGTLREELLSKGKIKEQVLTKDQLISANEIWFINSVRGWIRIRLV